MMISGFLEKIVADKQLEIESSEESRPISVLLDMIKERKHPRDFLRSISHEKLQLIAEIKKASPSRGLLRPDLDPVSLAKIYQDTQIFFLFFTAPFFLEDLDAIGFSLMSF